MSTGLISAEKYRNHLFAKGFWGYVHYYLGWGRAFLFFGYGLQLGILTLIALKFFQRFDVIEMIVLFHESHKYALKLLRGVHMMFLVIVISFFEITTGKYLAIPNTFNGLNFVLLLTPLALVDY